MTAPQKRGMSPDTLSGGALMLLGGAITFAAAGAGIGTLGDPDTGFLAFHLGIALAACGGLVAVVGWVRRAPGDRLRERFRGSGRSLEVIALLIVYSLLLERMGFPLTTFVLLWLLSGGLDRRRRWRAAGYAVALTAATYLLFEVVLDSGLPAGGWF